MKQPAAPILTPLFWKTRGFVSRAGLLVCLLWTLGCGGKSLQTKYGRTANPSDSVNGTATVAEMFAQKGHKVSSNNWVSSRLVSEIDTIVWFPDSVNMPNADVREFFDAWLSARPGRTLIFVGRDYDSAGRYWEEAAKLAPPAEAGLYTQMQAEANAKHAILLGVPPTETSEWFSQSAGPQRRIRAVVGDSRWLTGLNANAVDLEVRTRLDPPMGAHVLLATADDETALVSKQLELDSQLIVVANASFLTNFALVNHENRKLAARLIEEVPATGDVLFVESGPQGLSVLENPPEADSQSGLEFMALWPLNAILGLFSILGLLMVLSKAVTFGIPKDPVVQESHDKGQHLIAVAKLLESRQEPDVARQTLDHYRHMVAKTKDSGPRRGIVSGKAENLPTTG